MIASEIQRTVEEGQGMAAGWAHWAAAVLYNGLARYVEAASAARQATSEILNPWMSAWALPELVEAAARAGQAELGIGSRRELHAALAHLGRGRLPT